MTCTRRTRGGGTRSPSGFLNFHGAAGSFTRARIQGGSGGGGSVECT